VTVPVATTPSLEVYTIDENQLGSHTCSLKVAVEFSNTNPEFEPYVGFAQDFNIEITHACERTTLVVPANIPAISQIGG